MTILVNPLLNKKLLVRTFCWFPENLLRRAKFYLYIKSETHKGLKTPYGFLIKYNLPYIVYVRKSRLLEGSVIFVISPMQF